MKFSAVSQSLSRWAGSPRTFYAAVALILVWSLSGPYFHYNDTWQLIINTSTTIITFLMVFLIQNTQNRDNDILHRTFAGCQPSGTGIARLRRIS